MRITGLEINEHASKVLGLTQSGLKDLHQLVVLVGENGCGKSRLLSYVDWLLRQHARIGSKKLARYSAAHSRKRDSYLSVLDENDSHYTISGFSSDLEAFDRVLNPLKGLDLTVDQEEDIDASLAMYCKINSALCSTSHESGNTYQARLSTGLPRGDEPIDGIFAASPLVYITDICQRLANERVFETLSFHSPDQGVEKSFSALQDLVKKLSSLELKLSDTSEATLAGTALPSIKLSDGQLVLLRYAVLLHANILSDTGVPILIDEPEISLHPSTLVTLMDTLLERLPKSQIWIATHSLALTAHLSVFNPKAIWFGKDGCFSRAGRTPEKVVAGLLGGENGAAEIADFCTLTSQFAVVAFAAECLAPPVSVAYKKDDPQINQIHGRIPPTGPVPINVMDFGSGQGRLLEGLLYKYTSPQTLKDAISYYAIEIDAVSRGRCVKQICEIFDDAAQRVFENTETATHVLEHNVDIVVMSNVLHEIEPTHWLSGIFGKNGLGTLLKPGGKLLIVEDTQLPHGELAHDAGFVILQYRALLKLFGIQHNEHPLVRVHKLEKYGERLQATEINGSLLAHVTRDTIRAALHQQIQTSVETVSTLRRREQPPSYERGRAHAFHIHSIANATMALNILNLEPNE